MDRMKREREEQIKRDLAKRPRTEKLVWRGKVWDIMCYADLGDSIPRIIAWNKQGTTAPLLKLPPFSPAVLTHGVTTHNTHNTQHTQHKCLQMTFRRW